MPRWKKLYAVFDKFIWANIKIILSVLLLPWQLIKMPGLFSQATNASLDKIMSDYKADSDKRAGRIRDFFSLSKFPWVNRRRVEKLRRRAFFAKDETFLNTKVHIFVVLSTLMLQAIALFTTFRGTIVFFEGIHWTSPILFSAVLVGMFWLMANTAFSKRRRLWTRKILLFLLFLITGFISYIGLANSRISPMDEYRSQYERFAESYNHLLGLLRAEDPISNPFVEIERTYAEITWAMGMVQNESVRLQERLDALVYEREGISVPAPTEIRTPRWGFAEGERYHVGTDIVRDYTDRNRALDRIESLDNSISRLLGLIGSLDGVFTQAANPLNNDDFRAAITTFMAEPDQRAIPGLVDEFSDIFRAFNTSVMQYNNWPVTQANLRNTWPEDFQLNLTTRDDLPLTITAILHGLAAHWHLHDIDLIPFASDTEDSIVSRAQRLVDEREAVRPAMARDIYGFFLRGTVSPVLFEMAYQELDREINLRLESIQRAAAAIGVAGLESATAINYPIHLASYELSNLRDDLDIQGAFTFAASKLWPPGEWTLEIILIIIFALAVDGFTVLIPLWAEKRRYSVLYSQSSDDIKGDIEDILENMLLSAIATQVTPADKNSPLQYENELFLSALKNVHDFVDSFDSSPCTLSWGFPTRKEVNLDAPSAEISKNSRLLTLLQELGLVKYVSAWEYEQIQNDYHITQGDHFKDEVHIKKRPPYRRQRKVSPYSRRDRNAIHDNPSRGYYLMSRKFVLWMNDNQLSWFTTKYGGK